MLDSAVVTSEHRDVCDAPCGLDDEIGCVASPAFSVDHQAVRTAFEGVVAFEHAFDDGVSTLIGGASRKTGILNPLDAGRTQLPEGVEVTRAEGCV